MVKSVRPALGLEPHRLEQVLGKKAKTDLPSGIPLRSEDFE